jgi:ABC-type multidrug transport system ATPase subunit
VILSTHIVEDIGQTCRDLAVLAKGVMCFRGSPVELTRVAAGHVWTVTRPRVEEPAAGTTIVSMLHLADGVQYRLVGAWANPDGAAVPAAPSLEDGYVRLMQI